MVEKSQIQEISQNENYNQIMTQGQKICPFILRIFQISHIHLYFTRHFINQYKSKECVVFFSKYDINFEMLQIFFALTPPYTLYEHEILINFHI